MQRFGGLSEEELGQKVLPDYIKEDLDILLVGVNPSYTSVHVGHHYAGAGNHIWPCIYESGLIPQQMTCYEDSHLLAYGIGLTNLCSRPTRGATELTKKELKEGAEILLQKVKRYRPKIVAFNGKGIYESFSNTKNFYMGRQSSPMPGTTALVFVMPSSSARCSKLPRPHDKLPFFHALRKLRDWIRGRAPPPPDEEVVFTDYTQLRSLEPPLVDSSSRKRKSKGQDNPISNECFDKQLVHRYPSNNMMGMGVNMGVNMGVSMGVGMGVSPGYYPHPNRHYPSSNNATMMMTPMHSSQPLPNKTMHMMTPYPPYPQPLPNSAPPPMFMPSNYHIGSSVIPTYGDLGARCWPTMYSSTPMPPPTMISFSSPPQHFSNEPPLTSPINAPLPSDNSLTLAGNTSNVQNTGTLHHQHQQQQQQHSHHHHPAMDYRPAAHPEHDPSSLSLLSPSQQSQCMSNSMNMMGSVASNSMPCGSSTSSPGNTLIDSNSVRGRSESTYPAPYPSNYLPPSSQSSYIDYSIGEWNGPPTTNGSEPFFPKLSTPSSTTSQGTKANNDYCWESIPHHMSHNQIPMLQTNYPHAQTWISAATPASGPSCSNTTDLNLFNAGQQL